MKTLVRSSYLVFGLLLFVGIGMAQVPTGATGLCKDGTYATSSSKSSGCRGHKGVKEWYAAGATKSTKTSMPHHTSAMSTASTAKPGNATGLCKDGTYATSSSKSAGCRGHKGIKEWYGSTGAASSNAMSAPSSSPQAADTAPQQKHNERSASNHTGGTALTPAPGGGPGLVWLNTSSNVYHCHGSRYYGATKTGQYMTEAAAKAKGAHGEHGKACN